MGSSSEFEYEIRRNGDVVITLDGKILTTLHGARADRFLNDIELRDDQEVMARITGKFRRGDDRRRRED